MELVNDRFNGFTRTEKLAAFVMIYAVGSMAMRAQRYGIDVVGWLNVLGIYNPPYWLVVAILTAGTISLIVGALATFGIATVPTYVAYGLLAADTFGV